MIATVRDLDILQSVKPMQVAKYLQGKGWYEESKIEESVSIWLYQNNGKKWSLDLPLKPELKRFPLHISQVLETLEKVEGRSQLEILRDIHNVSADVIRLRVNSPLVVNGSIPLNNALEILQNLKNLIFSAASSTINPQLNFSQPFPEALEYLTKLRLGQTEENSGYVFTVISQLPEENTALNGEKATFSTSPFERRVVLKLVEALETINALAEAEKWEDFLGKEPQGISANLCDAVVALNESVGGEGIEINLSWSGLISVPPETSDVASATLRDRLLLPPKIMSVLRQAAENFPKQLIT